MCRLPSLARMISRILVKRPLIWNHHEIFAILQVFTSRDKATPGGGRADSVSSEPHITKVDRSHSTPNVHATITKLGAAAFELPELVPKGNEAMRTKGMVQPDELFGVSSVSSSAPQSQSNAVKSSSIASSPNKSTSRSVSSSPTGAQWILIHIYGTSLCTCIFFIECHRDFEAAPGTGVIGRRFCHKKDKGGDREQREGADRRLGNSCAGYKALQKEYWTGLIWHGVSRILARKCSCQDPKCQES